MRCLADVNLNQPLPSEVHPIVGSLAQQRLSLYRFTRAAFTMEQHHREVVLTERMPLFRGSAEVMARLDVIAHEPRRPSLHQVWIGGSVPHLGFSAGSAHARKE